MQTSYVQPSWPILQEYAGLGELAKKNSDPNSWEWGPGSRAVWDLADDHWQRFSAMWGEGTESQCASLVDPTSPSLSLDPLPSDVVGSTSTILVRKSYEMMFDHVWARAMSSEGKTGAIITGQPGTGKTLFQFYLLVRLLQYQQLVLFSLDGVSLYLFYHGKVYTATLAAVQPGVKLPKPKSPPSKVFIWSLFDIEERKGPAKFLVRRPCLPVQTASLDPSRYKTWDKEQTPMLTGLPLWTHDELAQGLRYQELYQCLLDALSKADVGTSRNQADSDQLSVFPGSRALLEEREDVTTLLSPEEALDYLLEAAIDRFGHSARDVFGAVFDFEGTTQYHQDAFSMTYADLQAVISALGNNRTASYNSSHRILALCPVYSDAFVRVRWTVKFKSDWIARNVFRKLDETRDKEIRLP